MSEDAARKDRERAFHDGRYDDDEPRAGARKYYAINRASQAAYRAALTVGAGDAVLEYGCGRGSAAFDLARAGAQVTGIDISTVAIDVARGRAAQEGVDATSFCVMDAERLEFDDASFDLVCGSGILHHLDLARALPEVARVLRPSGRAVFLEPLGHNLLINLYRRRTPEMRTEDEHPLLLSDLDGCRVWFDQVDVRPFHLVALAAVPARRLRAFERILGAADRFDAAIFRRFERLGRYAWTVVLELSHPSPRS